jgi:hypothetical protein
MSIRGTHAKPTSRRRAAVKAPAPQSGAPQGTALTPRGAVVTTIAAAHPILALRPTG